MFVDNYLEDLPLDLSNYIYELKYQLELDDHKKHMEIVFNQFKSLYSYLVISGRKISRRKISRPKIPTEYNLFIQTKIKEFRVGNPTMDRKELMVAAAAAAAAWTLQKRTSK